MFSDVDISGVSSELKAFSRIDNINSSGADLGFVLKKDNPIFTTTTVGNFDRSIDTEAKILEEIAEQIGDNYSKAGSIKLFTERTPCESCLGVIQQFKNRYPNIEITVYDNTYNVLTF